MEQKSHQKEERITATWNLGKDQKASACADQALSNHSCHCCSDHGLFKNFRSSSLRSWQQLRKKHWQNLTWSYFPNPILIRLLQVLLIIFRRVMDRARQLPASFPNRKWWFLVKLSVKNHLKKTWRLQQSKQKESPDTNRWGKFKAVSLIFKLRLVSGVEACPL